MGGRSEMDHYALAGRAAGWVVQFDPDGQPVLTLGNGESGFQAEDVSFNEVQFSWVYDIRCGSDGNIYVLDSRNFVVRKIDLRREVVTRTADV